MSTSGGQCCCCYSFGGLETLSSPMLDVYTLIYNNKDLVNEDSQIITCLQCCEFLKEIYRFRNECRDEAEEEEQAVGKSSQLEIKNEVIDTVEVEFDPENSIQTSELFPMTQCTEMLLKCDNCTFKCVRKQHMVAHQASHSKISEKSTQFVLNGGEQDSIKGKRKSTGNKINILIHNDKSFKCSECSHQTTDIYKLKLHIARRHCDEKPFTCDQCNFCAKTKENLRAHKLYHLNDCDKPHKCGECSFKTIDSYKLKVHIKRRHSDDKPFSCDQCNYCAKIKEDIAVHKNRIHLDKTDKAFKCVECSFETTTKRYLQRHVIRNHSDDKPFSCDQCDFSTTMKYDLTAHKNIHLDNANNPFKCTECSFKTTAVYKLKLHVVRKHSNEKPFSCDQCNYCAKTKYELTAHKKIHLENIDSIFKCSECSFQTTTRRNLQRHNMRRHDDDKPFTCDQCNFCTKIKSDLTKHQRSHLDDCDKPYKCNECSYKTTTMFQLKIHIAHKHSDERPFACDQCSFRTKIKHDLTAHKHIHLDNADNPFKCNECSFKTTAVYKLKLHIARKHSGEKLFCCDQCNYCSKTKRNLINHKRTHLDECDRPYKCSECSFKATAASKLKIHIARKHSDVKPFSCDQCDFRSKMKEDLTKHKRLHVDSDENPFKCSVCSYKTTTTYKLKVHISRKHSDEQPFSETMNENDSYLESQT